LAADLPTPSFRGLFFRVKAERINFRSAGRFGLHLRLAFQTRALLNRLRSSLNEFYVASPHCFGSLTTVWLADILGLDATPELSGPDQGPLVAVRLHQDPKSIATSCCQESLLTSRLRPEF
jgi:hypothetical protein